ncbi:MAG: asparaginase [Desulfarculus sp.]|nr:asparaginase [Desulfarculus sp.]
MLDYIPAARHRGGHHHHHGDDGHHHHGGGAPPEYAPPLVELRRGGLTESVHRGAVAVCDASGKRLRGLGHPAMPSFLRSAAKPLQALPVITTGAMARFGLDQRELACMCGSLNGEDFQVATVLSILGKAGLGPELLACGVHPPSHRPTAKALRTAGQKPQPVHNNCAGKHAAMLVLCAHLGYDTQGYTQPSHPVQGLILRSVAQMCAYPAEQIGVGIDGCGVPVFRVPLIALAGAYARLADPAGSGLPAETAQAVERLMAACLVHPEMIAGTERLCTRLMQAAPGRLLAKTGTEGTYALAIPEMKLGVAFQIEDGAARALAPVACNLLHELDIVEHATLEGALADLARPQIKNHRGEVVAELTPVFGL